MDGEGVWDRGKWVGGNCLLWWKRGEAVSGAKFVAFVGRRELVSGEESNSYNAANNVLMELHRVEKLQGRR